MATSSKVKFNLQTLTEQALESLDTRIEQAKSKVASHTDEEALATQTSLWREVQEAKVLRLASQLQDPEIEVSDRQLAKFCLEDMPDPGNRYEQRRDLDRYNDLLVRRGEISAKAASLVADEDGGISLTRTQLREFFDL